MRLYIPTDFKSTQPDTKTLLKIVFDNISVAQLFNPDSSDEEEMPAEAKMKMRNIGRETITSAGPNSFGKTKQGFCDDKKLFEKKLQDAMDNVCGD